MRIAFLSPEVVPFAKTGGLADVCGSLPVALEKLGHEVVVIMPHYRCVGAQEHFNDRVQVATIGRNVKVFFLIHKKFFERPELYGTHIGDYEDNLDRFAFFCHEALHFLKGLGTPFDIIHCHEWQTGLVPALLKDVYKDDPFFAQTRSVFTIHNLAYQGLFPKDEYPKLGVDPKFFNDSQIEFYDKINLMKTGIVFSDHVTTVSPQYAKEIQTQEFGCWIEGVLASRRDNLTGILNGLDYAKWDPARDKFIDPPYSADDWSAKARHKAMLQDKFGLPRYTDIPLFGFVGRLCYQKGLDLIERVYEDLMLRPIQAVFLGVGEEKYQRMLQRLSRHCPQKFGALIKYNDDIAHSVYAGSDFFLMPSIYEPCGLTQMISLRYGSIPITSYVGGLVDTMVDLSSVDKQGNSLVMPEYSVSGFLETIDRAVSVYHQKNKMRLLVTNAMKARWTWDESAQHYVECYQKCLRSV